MMRQEHTREKEREVEGWRERDWAIDMERKEHMSTFSNVLYTVTLDSKYTRALTFQNVYLSLYNFAYTPILT